MMMLHELNSLRHKPNLSSSVLVLCLVATSTASLVATPPTHSLLTTTLSAFGLWIYELLRVGSGLQARNDTVSHRTTCWLVGVFFALVELCRRASSNNGLLWVSALLPPVLYTARIWRREHGGSLDQADPRSIVERVSAQAERNIVLLTVLGLLILGNSYITLENITLGLSSVMFTVTVYLILESILPKTLAVEEVHEKEGNAFEGLLSRDSACSDIASGLLDASIRDVSAVVMVACGISTYWFESLPSGGFSGQAIFGSAIGLQYLSIGVACLAEAASTVILFFLISRCLMFESSLGLMGAAFAHQILTHFSFTSLWFAYLGVLTATLLFRDRGSIHIYSGEPSRYSKFHRGATALICVSLSVWLVSHLFHLDPTYSVQRTGHISLHSPLHEGGTSRTTNTDSHPIKHLMTQSRREFDAILSYQSRSLKEAVAEYEERYRKFPPPNFDKWYEFAKLHDVQMIDEYDTIYHDLQPFWAVKPSVLRRKVQEAIGFEENALLAIKIRDGAVVKLEGGEQWQMDATLGMLESFVQYLPDMDLAFNTHNEPRVVVPHDQLSRMVALANLADLTAEQQNVFSRRPGDLDDGKEIEEFKTSVFNSYPHQSNWASSSLSCHPDSPARSIDPEFSRKSASDSTDSLTFVSNQTAFTDICQSPWLAESHGFFERPNVFKVTHDLVPIFSESKVSSFQDILYPSPWYWYGKYPENGTDVMHIDGNEQYEEKADMDWDSKNDTLWWRGSNTGGYSKYGSWRHHHRQGIVQDLNGLGTTLAMTKSDSGSTHGWKTTSVPKSQFRDSIDVKFTAIGQCDPDDCHAQEEYFTVVPSSDFQQTWQSKYLLDMDGNAFSGRFYSLLKSHSTVLKMAIFREWHQDWLKPWLHYVPLTLRGDEAFEVLRYLSKEGADDARQMAKESREWASGALRRKDMEAWFFRLLLEYGRLIDDNRTTIGYVG